MIKTVHFFIFLTLLCLVVIVTQGVAQAEDEDLTSSVYLVFDAETGEFIEVNDTDRTKQRHAARDPTDAALSDETPKLSLPVSLAIVTALLAVILGWGRVSRARQAGTTTSNTKSS
ncbi:MAG: hypothetical protein IH838_10500 [Proteobacteria bacterium]|nr:hypothetical protein [Pseudomonadota bacterium]